MTLPGALTRSFTRTQQRLAARSQALPLRTRLVGGFVIAITLVLAAAGSFVYWRVSYALDVRLSHEAHDGMAALRPLINTNGTLRPDASTGATSAGRLYQVVDFNGKVLSAGADVGTAPVLQLPALGQAATDSTPVDVGALLPRSNHPLRVFVAKINQADGHRGFLLVAVRRDQRDEALRELLAQLTIAGLSALVITALVGERLARAALAPVERYRTQAARIADGATGVRLEVPPQRDDEVTRLGQTLNTMLESLEHNVAREKLFTAEASHELRTPLTVLSTRVQLALSRPRSHGELLETLTALEQEITDLSRLADGLLSLTTAADAATTAHGAGLRLSALGAVLRGVVADHPDASLADFNPTVQQSHYALAITDQQFKQIVRNLLGNAETHGAPPVSVEASLVGGGKPVLRLRVTDHGAGMPSTFVPRAIERFARAEDAQNRAGAGLGLALVHDLVTRGSGELRVCLTGSHHRFSHSTLPVLCEHPNDGTVVTILLPVHTDSS